MTPYAVLACALVAAPPSTETTPETKTDEVGSERTLAGHMFLPSSVLPWAFATHHFAFGVGLGFLSGDLGVTTIDGRRANLPLEVAAFTNVLQYQLPIGENFALRAQASAQMLGGTNEDAALFFGANFGFVGGGGATATFRLIDRVQLSLLVDASTGPSYNLSLLRGINSSLETGTVSLGNGLADGQDTNLRTDALVAIGAHPALGILVNGGYGHDFTTFDGQSSDSGAARMGLGLSFDAEALVPVPLGLLVTYGVDFPTIDTDPSHVGTIGVFYSGRSSLGLGLEGALFLEPSGTGNQFSTFQGIFRLQYFW